MNCETLQAIADKLNADLAALQSSKLYVNAFFYPEVSTNGKFYPDRIIVEGCKNLRTTGRFTSKDRDMINRIIGRHCADLSVKLIVNDQCLHNAIITDKHQPLSF